MFPEPHEVVGIEIPAFVAEGTFAHLRHEAIVPLARGVGGTYAKLIAGNVVPILGTEIQVDWRTVVFIPTDAHHLFSGVERPMVVEGVGEVNPVGCIKETLVGVCLVQALAVGVGPMLADVAAEYDVEVFATEAGIGFHSVSLEKLVLIVDARFELQVNDLVFL